MLSIVMGTTIGMMLMLMMLIETAATTASTVIGPLQFQSFERMPCSFVLFAIEMIVFFAEPGISFPRMGAVGMVRRVSRLLLRRMMIIHNDVVVVVVERRR